MHHILTLWTSDPGLAARADRAGVDRVGLDLEQIGKTQRQRGHPTWVSPHTIADLDRIVPVMQRAELFVRTNPVHSGSRDEINALIGVGVRVLMLPNFTTLKEVDDYLRMVDGRARVVPLVERLAAVGLIDNLPELGVDEIHVGLNDLAIDLRLPHRLGALISPTMDSIAVAARRSRLRLGIGGLGRAMDVNLPIPTDLVYAQQTRLGSSAALVARSFHSANHSESDFFHEVREMRKRLDYWRKASPAALEDSTPEANSRLCRDYPYGAPWSQMSKLGIFNPNRITETHYTPGRHQAAFEGEVILPDADEVLNLHYKYTDAEQTYARHQALAARLGPADIANKWGHKYGWEKSRLQQDFDEFRANLIHISHVNHHLEHREPRWWRPSNFGHADWDADKN